MSESYYETYPDHPHDKAVADLYDFGAWESGKDAGWEGYSHAKVEVVEEAGQIAMEGSMRAEPASDRLGKATVADNQFGFPIEEERHIAPGASYIVHENTGSITRSE